MTYDVQIEGDGTMAPATYPEQCLSMYCGRICCDGCPSRPVLAAYHQQHGDLDKYEARQVKARETVATWAAERAARESADSPEGAQ